MSPTRGIGQRLTGLFKKMDSLTGNVAGRIIRSATNINTKDYWNKRLSKYGDKWRDYPYEHLLEFLPSDSPFSLLDVGCSLGDGCILIKKRFPHASITGVDFSNVGIEAGRKKSSEINFRLLDITKEDPPGKYDFITIVSTLEHFDDPFPIVDKLLKFATIALLVETPYTESFELPHLYSKGEHRYLFNKETFSAYNCTSIKVTENTEQSGYRYIVYRLESRT